MGALKSDARVACTTMTCELGMSWSELIGFWAFSCLVRHASVILWAMTVYWSGEAVLINFTWCLAASASATHVLEGVLLLGARWQLFLRCRTAQIRVCRLLQCALIVGYLIVHLPVLQRRFSACEACYVGLSLTLCAFVWTIPFVSTDRGGEVWFGPRAFGCILFGLAYHPALSRWI